MHNSNYFFLINYVSFNLDDLLFNCYKKATNRIYLTWFIQTWEKKKISKESKNNQWSTRILSNLFFHECLILMEPMHEPYLLIPHLEINTDFNVLKYNG